MVGEAAARRTVTAPGQVQYEPAIVTALHPAPEPHRLYFVTRRCIDIVLALMLLVFALPILALASLAILLTNRRSPLLLQRRVGWLGREFTMFKLRTMRDEGATPGVFGEKALHDERVTVVGRLLRRTSIDELPQLINVLAGRMTLVGPRPGLPSEVALYLPSWRGRLSVKPGLSGLWQVSGRSGLPLERWMALDRLYIRRRSTGFDLIILARTVAAVASMRGAW
jgi:lipopolysaccharide/colanic/teichoic acid biosynthesis glycosyltransferase